MEGCSLLFATFLLGETIAGAKDHKSQPIITFMNSSKAFDVYHEVILKAIHQQRITGYISSYMEEFAKHLIYHQVARTDFLFLCWRTGYTPGWPTVYWTVYSPMQYPSLPADWPSRHTPNWTNPHRCYYGHRWPSLSSQVGIEHARHTSTSAHPPKWRSAQAPTLMADFLTAPGILNILLICQLQEFWIFY